MSERLLPTGTCWCGCGKETARGSFFVRGHDKIAEAAIIAARYGNSVAQLVHDHHFTPDPDNSVRAAALAAGWIECPLGCGYAGAPASVRKHEAKPHKEK